MVLSLYVWLFGITGVIGDSVDTFADESDEFNPTIQDIRSNKDSNDKSDNVNAIITDEPVTYYETSINAENYRKPDLADYPAQTTKPFYFGEPEETTTSITENTEQITSPITSDSTTQTTTTAQTTITSEDLTITTTIQTTAEATTTTPVTTTTTAVATTTTTAVATTVTTQPPTVTETDEPADPEPFDDYIVEPPPGNSLENETVSVSVSGSKVVEGGALNIISRMVQNEIGSSFNKEAIKAQAVAAYTYVKLYNSNGLPARDVNLANDASERVMECVREVLGQVIYYNGEIIQALYCASTAGYTASAKNVYGNEFPYLQSKECKLDMSYDPNYGLSKTFSSNDIMTRVLSKTGIELTGDPNEWIKVLSHVDTAYVGNMTIGGESSFKSNGNEVTITGRVFRETIMDRDIRSAAFEVSYDKKSDKFTFVTYGYGHGVGMSQNGANALAQYEGYDYKQILQFYYTGTEIY